MAVYLRAHRMWNACRNVALSIVPLNVRNTESTAANWVSSRALKKNLVIFHGWLFSAGQRSTWWWLHRACGSEVPMSAPRGHSTRCETVMVPLGRPYGPVFFKEPSSTISGFGS